MNVQTSAFEFWLILKENEVEIALCVVTVIIVTTEACHYEKFHDK